MGNRGQLPTLKEHIQGLGQQGGQRAVLAGSQQPQLFGDCRVEVAADVLTLVAGCSAACGRLAGRVFRAWANLLLAMLSSLGISDMGRYQLVQLADLGGGLALWLDLLGGQAGD